jgi:hypothetical protein
MTRSGIDAEIGRARKKGKAESSEGTYTLKEKIGIRKFARDTGIDRRTLRTFVRKEALGEKAARRILNELRNYELNGDRERPVWWSRRISDREGTLAI